MCALLPTLNIYLPVELNSRGKLSIIDYNKTGTKTRNMCMHGHIAGLKHYFVDLQDVIFILYK